MPCFSPVSAYYTIKSNGKKELSFDGNLSRLFSDGKKSFCKDVLQLPCGKCRGCRLERSRQWATRIMHEASLYDDNCFVTLTYDDEHLPVDRSLDVRDFQLFMKRLRKQYGAGVRFFHCGEYGDSFDRPHYHVCLFNLDFSDKVLWSCRDGIRSYTSDNLCSLWGKGFCTLGDLTFESAAYVARYCFKKVTGKDAADHYKYVDVKSGIVYSRRAEYCTMSRRPGIGSKWYDRFKKDCYPKDFITVNGVKCKVPRYYDKRLELESPEILSDLRVKREARALRKAHDNTYVRLKVREKVLDARLNRLKRTVD